MERFYFNPEVSLRAGGVGGFVTLDEDESHHLRDVKRRSAGDEIVLFDGEGKEFSARIKEREGKLAVAEITGLLRESPIKTSGIICAACAVPKGRRLVAMVEKLAELGADVIRLVQFERSRGDERPSLKKLRKVAISACKQSGRLFIPELHPVAPFGEFLAGAAAYNVKLFGSPSGGPALPPLNGKNAVFAVGPEGGFTDGELAALEGSGFSPFRVGENVLRVETAALAMLACILAAAPPRF